LQRIVFIVDPLENTKDITKFITYYYQYLRLRLLKRCASHAAEQGYQAQTERGPVQNIMPDCTSFSAVEW